MIEDNQIYVEDKGLDTIMSFMIKYCLAKDIQPETVYMALYRAETLALFRLLEKGYSEEDVQYLKDTIMDDLQHIGQDHKKWMKVQMLSYNSARLHSTPKELQKLGLDFGALDHMIAEKVLGRNEYGLNGAIIKCRNGCGHDIYYDRKFRYSSAGSLIPMDVQTNEEHKCKK
jgi:hypothetical protein